jgi:hypothetical protein
MSAKFPTSVATDADLSIAVNNLNTTLTDNPLSDSATTVNVISTTGFPTAGYVTVEFEIIAYTGKTGTSFTGCTRGADGTAASSHSLGESVFLNIIAAHHNSLKDEIKAIEQNLSDRIGLPSASGETITLTSAEIATVAATGLYVVADTSELTGVVTVIGGVTLTEGVDWTKGAYNDTTAQLFAVGINNKVALQTIVTAYCSGGEGDNHVTLTAVTPGSAGNSIGISSSQPTYLTVSNSTLTGGLDASSSTVSINTAHSNNARTYTIPDTTTLANFLMSKSSQTVEGQNTFKSAVIIDPTTNQLVLGGVSAGNKITITAPAPSADRVLTIPDPGENAAFVMNKGTQTVSGIKTFDTQLIGKGTLTNDSAATSYIGEYLESIVSTFTSVPANAVIGDVTSLTLTGGDWDITGLVTTTAFGATVTGWWMGLSITSGNSETGLVDGYNIATPLSPNAASNMTSCIPKYRLSRVAGSTVVYLKIRMVYSGGPVPKAAGSITARRVR